jgi:hypothetical protein
VPYALKAGDATTIGGLPPSAFVLAAPPNSAAAAPLDASATTQTSALPTGTAVTGTGTLNFRNNQLRRCSSDRCVGRTLTP